MGRLQTLALTRRKRLEDGHAHLAGPGVEGKDGGGVGVWDIRAVTGAGERALALRDRGLHLRPECRIERFDRDAIRGGQSQSSGQLRQPFPTLVAGDLLARAAPDQPCRARLGQPAVLTGLRQRIVMSACG